MNILLDKSLSILLDWLKLPVRAFWQLFSSPDRNTGLSASVLPILLAIICITGVAADIAVGISARKRRRAAAAAAQPEINAEPVPETEIPSVPQPGPIYSRPAEEESPYAAYRRPPQEFGGTMEYQYARILSKNAGSVSLEMEAPVFDDAPVQWEQPIPQYASQPEQPMVPAEEMHYNFARPLPPQETAVPAP